VAGGLFAVLWGIALARWWTFLGSYDLAYFDQAAWLIAHGHSPFISLRGLHLLGDHASFVFFPLGWLAGQAGRARIIGVIPLLLGVQAAALALGAVPLWRIARRLAGLTVGTSVALLGAWCLYPALSNIDLFDFHPEVLAVPALLGAAWFGLSRRRVPYAACVAVVLLCREDLAVPVLFLGLLLVLDGDRVTGGATMAVAAVWGVLDLAVVLPHFANGAVVQGSRFAQYGPTLGKALSYMATHPLQVAGDFATKPNARVLLGLFLPVLLLPFLAPKYLLPGLPLQLAYLLTNVPAAHTLTAQYTASTIPFVFLATAMALPRLRGRVDRRVVRGALVGAAAIAFVVAGSASPRHHPWRWLTRDATDHARLAAARLVPNQAPVAATIRVAPLLAERTKLYAFPQPLAGYDDFSNSHDSVANRQSELRWVVLDTADGDQFQANEATWRDRLTSLGFRIVFDRRGIVVYQR
jgi:uncharacterized membrane protein